jgi:drug/metabolite transporter (DMT)-like permease
MLAQGVSNVVAKTGLDGMTSPVAATQIRLIAGLLCFLVLAPLVGKHKDCIKTFKDRSTMMILTAGTIAGPTIGVALLMYAITRIPTGLAMTFTSLSTVMIIPLSAIIHKEKITRRAICGALIACTGSALLLL